MPIASAVLRASISDQERVERIAKRRRQRATLPAPGPIAARLAVAVLEVAAGLRPPQQLARVSHVSLWDRWDVIAGAGGPFVSRDHLRRLLVREQSPGLVDVVALIQRRGRVESVALCLDGASGRWELTEAQWSLTPR